MKLHVFTLLLLLLTALPPWRPALAEDPKDAVQLFNMASELAEKGRYKDAIRIWVDIAEELPLKYQATVQMNLGLAYRQLEHMPEAWHHLNQAKRLSKGKQDDVNALLKEVETELVGIYTKVLMFTLPDGGTIYLNDKPEGTAYDSPLTWWLPKGNLNIFATMEGYESTTIPIVVKGGIGPYQSVKIQLKSLASGPVIDKPADRKSGGSKAWKWALVGGGAATVVVGAILGGVASSKNEDLKAQYPDGQPGNLNPYEYGEAYEAAYDEDVQPKLTASYVLYGVGGAAAVAGGIFLILDVVKGDEATAVSIAPMTSPEGPGAAFTLTW